MSINRGMDKEDMVHIYNGILFSHKKDEITVCSNTDGPGDCHSEGRDKFFILLLCGI